MSDRSTGTAVVFPYWPENPFLNIAYLALRADGWTISEQRDLAGFLDAVAVAAPGDVVHLHWTSLLVQNAPDEREADRRLATVVRALTDATGRGVRLVWTVHNRLPHDCPWPRQEIELSRAIVGLSSAVHVMSAQTRDVVADVVDIPLEKQAIVPHPSYEGLYDQAWTRDEARGSFGLGPAEKTVLFFGHIKPYKGVSTLLGAIGTTGATLLLAGHVSHADRLTTEALVPSDATVHAHYGYVPDDDAGRWFAAADVLVVPYAAILNSGSIHLASTFGLPVIVPGFAHLVEQFRDEPWVVFSDPEGGEEGLAAAIDAFAPSDDLRAAARRYALRYTPYAMSTDMLALYDSLSV
ncbi:glycosyltransferase [Frigoribacterium faeni]|uniref:Glycosyltransferase involved in cell wall biosynthesis n=1 Tax=Frigoribacterium faeni TaxID=145483 RepID=A0A7W3JGB7_9MICO|nr:glycosyltransferase [Frigoribacterium faeni]MBA8812288.1 glycosyltransferase involved in cell wall biosynthesis [Frigoribacterium faeni]BFF13336.1 glycosyltransferase [Microbacterium flavescens]GEK83140.1 peptidase M14 [Frigoribacterium faeni]